MHHFCSRIVHCGIWDCFYNRSKYVSVYFSIVSLIANSHTIVDIIIVSFKVIYLSPFSIENDWTFDEFAVRNVKCEVHSFDPTYVTPAQNSSQ